MSKLQLFDRVYLASVEWRRAINCESACGSRRVRAVKAARVFFDTRRVWPNGQSDDLRLEPPRGVHAVFAGAGVRRGVGGMVARRDSHTYIETKLWSYKEIIHIEGKSSLSGPIKWCHPHESTKVKPLETIFQVAPAA